MKENGSQRPTEDVLHISIHKLILKQLFQSSVVTSFSDHWNVLKNSKQSSASLTCVNIKKYKATEFHMVTTQNVNLKNLGLSHKGLLCYLPCDFKKQFKFYVLEQAKFFQ